MPTCTPKRRRSRDDTGFHLPSCAGAAWSRRLHASPAIGLGWRTPASYRANQATAAAWTRSCMAATVRSAPVFLDSGILIAFLNAGDQWHEQAVYLFALAKPRWCTSLLVVSEAY